MKITNKHQGNITEASQVYDLNTNNKKKDRVIALVDCNNFYASCERVFNPKLEGKALVVLSNNDGCVIARSNEAKAIGIPMGEPIHKCAYLIKRHNVQVYSSNFALYGDMSDRVMQTLCNLVPDLEIYSIDEAFLNLDSFKAIDLTAYSQFVRQTVKKWTGIPVSVGIGPTKTLAKIANHIAKSNPKSSGVVNLINNPHIDKYLEKIKVKDIWGIGKSFAGKLNRRCIYTALDLKRSPEKLIKENLGITGLRTALELKGIACNAATEDSDQRKSVSCSRSFAKALTSFEELSEATATYISRVSEKLRRDNLKASFIHLYIRTNHHNKNDKQYANSICLELKQASAYTPELIQKALEALKQIYRDGYHYKKVGVTLTGLLPEENTQMSFLTSQASAQSQANNELLEIIENGKLELHESLMKTMDQINRRWGNDSLQYASTGMKSLGFSGQSNKSKNFTTNWSEILQIA